MSEAVLKLENLSKAYSLGKRNVQALSNLNLQVNKGEFTAIMGPSGSGKTTLLNVLGCLDKPTGGRVLLDDVDVPVQAGDPPGRSRLPDAGGPLPEAVDLGGQLRVVADAAVAVALLDVHDFLLPLADAAAGLDAGPEDLLDPSSGRDVGVGGEGIEGAFLQPLLRLQRLDDAKLALQ